MTLAAGMTLPRFSFEAPDGVGAACSLLAQARGDARPMAGGTDLLVKMKAGLLAPKVIVSLARVPGLDAVEPSADGGLRIGALASMATLAAHPTLRGPRAALAEGAGSVGGPIVRNRATIGGNIVSARPCADTAPPLIALGARLHLAGATGRRVADIDGFITGPGETRIGEAEILTAFELPRPSPHAGSCYVKITRRAAMEVTVVGCAAAVDLDDDLRTIRSARIVLASVAPTPLRVPAAEATLAGASVSEGAIDAAAVAARDAAAPIDDHRAPAWYRREVTAVIVRRALRAAIERAGGTAS